MAKSNFKFDMRKLEKSLNKEIDKIVKKKQEEINIKHTVKGAEGMYILPKMEEEMLSIILSMYDGRNDLCVSGDYSEFPEYMKFSIHTSMDKLIYSGYIASKINTMSGWSLYLTLDGISYFEKKGMREELFNELPDNSKGLLKELIDNEFNEKGIDELLREKIEQDKTDRIIRGMIGTLKDNGLISVSWADNTVYYAELTDAGRTYFEREKKYMDRLKQLSGDTYNINNSGIFNMGSIENLNVNIDNSIKKIEEQIEVKGEEDKQDLKEVLQEVKDYIDNVKETKVLGKNGGLFKRLSNHLSKHRMVLCRNSGITRASLLNSYGWSRS